MDASNSIDASGPWFAGTYVNGLLNLTEVVLAGLGKDDLPFGMAIFSAGCTEITALSCRTSTLGGPKSAEAAAGPPSYGWQRPRSQAGTSAGTHLTASSSLVWIFLMR